ncbi:efflux RND transporter periplasmic adaptor subunit [Alcanivorax sp.]|uniref:efflux RND transporter periplasmic adaptor subunit n=1 Tax=Alcanivorax sp. TaxID=1872427 RepID=UPI003450CF4D
MLTPAIHPDLPLALLDYETTLNLKITNRTPMPSLSLSFHFLFRVVLLMSFAAPGLADDRKPVSVATVSLSRSQDALLVNGTLVADRAARLSVSVSGLVSKLLVDIGDQVDAGAPLIEMDAELNRLELQRARANYQQQQAILGDARRRLEEANSLVARRSIAASEVRSLESEVQVAKSSLAASQAEVARQQALLERHTLKAPFSGVISAKLTEVGEWLTPGSTVFELVGSDELHADFAVPQRYFPQISLDTGLEVWLDDEKNRPMAAEITAIVPVNDPTARTFTVRASIDEQGLTPGMAINGRLRMLSADARPTVPRDALLQDSQGNVTVWLAEGDGDDLVARRKVVKVASGQSPQASVLEGLSSDDRVVVRGNESLRDGDKLRVVD